MSEQRRFGWCRGPQRRRFGIWVFPWWGNRPTQVIVLLEYFLSTSLGAMPRQFGATCARSHIVRRELWPSPRRGILKNAPLLSWQRRVSDYARKSVAEVLSVCATVARTRD